MSDELTPPDELTAETLDELERLEREASAYIIEHTDEVEDLEAFLDWPKPLVDYVCATEPTVGARLIAAARSNAARGERIRQLAEIVHSDVNEGDKITWLMTLLEKP
jgi:hypothetical protein